MKNREFDEFITEISRINGIQAIVLGGSRTTKYSDNNADYDIYIYSENGINRDTRQEILSKYSDYYELSNNYWELEDNGLFKWGIYFDLIYRNLLDITKKIENVVENYQCHNGFTTCLWHNILNAEIIFDKNEIYTKMKKRFQVPYPKKLKENIIKRNMALLTNSIISYDKQISKSAYRKDYVNINNRLSAFFASYFDIIFAINELTHPGEKRIMEICNSNCKILPNGFEQNVNKLINNANNEIKIIETVNNVILELQKIVEYGVPTDKDIIGFNG
ncbi:MAG: DUF4037 domain-containing protein [Firmicutes bacterium]|nr:DUF4037 domain-containing protein [Bacillota bacterium]